jgi:uncharacterized protein (DUF885 family)
MSGVAVFPFFSPMKLTRLAVLSLLFAALIASTRAAQSFDAWADDFAARWARLSPQFATRTQYFSGAEQDALDRQLTLVGSWGTAFGQSAEAGRAALARRGLGELRAFPREGLSATQRTSAALLAWVLEDAVAAAEFAEHRPIFNQMTGLQLELVNFMSQTHPIRQQRDLENYLARLALVAPLIDAGIVEARAAGEKGFLPPRFIVQRTIEQLDGMLMLPPRENVFVLTFVNRVAALGNVIPAAEREKAAAAAEKLVTDAVIPAYTRVRALLAEQLPKTTDEAGIWRFARGDAQYRNALATYTTGPLTADEIHAVGLREVARLEGEMDKILRELGYKDGTVNARYAALDATLVPPGDPRAELLARSLSSVRDAEKRSARLFDLLPKAPVDVQREPAFSERTAAAHYTPPAPDGSKPGTFWLPLPGPMFPVMRTRSLSYHEAVPGHHFQMALQAEMKDLPRWRSAGVFGFISAYGEGWGLYAERLADENNWYDGDPKGRLGYLNSMLFRARRLVVDTGLHAKHWTRQQAIDYGINAQEVERYVVWPGQACSYMIGQMRIVELREKARAALGDKFSVQQFHNIVLRAGNVPLDVLAQEVDAWTAAKK